MTTKYAQGRQFEYKVRDYLVEHGFFVIRSAGSKGVVDLVAFKTKEILFIQAKRTGILPPHEWNSLYWLATDLGAVPLMAQEPSGRGQSVQLFILQAPKTGRGERQPLHPYKIQF